MGTRWAGRVMAGNLEAQDSTHQLFDIEVSHTWEDDPIEWSCGASERDTGYINLTAGKCDGSDDHKTCEAYFMMLTEDDALRLAFLLTRAVGWVEDERSDLPDVRRQVERVSAASNADPA